MVGAAGRCGRRGARERPLAVRGDRRPEPKAVRVRTDDLCHRGSGGVGASTLAAGLAFVAARSGRRTALVDLDPGGGGLDLLVGAERLDGWRWPRLVAARGHLGDLGNSCRAWTGSRCCRWAGAVRRSGCRPRPLRAVLGSLTASHELTVVDVPRLPGQRPAGAVVDGRGLAAAGSGRPSRRDGRAGVLPGPGGARRPARPGRPHRPDAVARPGAALPTGSARTCTRVLGDEPGLLQAAERGDPPGRSGRSPLGQVARRLLDEIGRSLDAARMRGAGVSPLAVDLDPLRDRLAGLGRAPTPADVATAMRAEGRMVSDAALIETVEALRRHSVARARWRICCARPE